MSDFVEETQTCPTVAYQLSSVCVPVTVTPFARTGVTVTKCCKKPTVTAGRYICDGIKNGQASLPSVRISAWKSPWNSAPSPQSETPMSPATAPVRTTSVPIAR